MPSPARGTGVPRGEGLCWHNIPFRAYRRGFHQYHSPDGLHSDLYYLPLPQYILLHSILSDTSHATMAQSPQEPLSSRLSSTLKATAGSLTSSVKPAESELARWRRTFDRFAKEEIDGQK